MAKEPDVGLKIGIEGEKEFKTAIKDINESYKVLKSEMKLVVSEFDKNDKSVQSTAARNAVLNKEIDAQKDKIATLGAALKNATESFEEGDSRTKNWAVQLNNAKAELNDMERELSESSKEADDLGDELKESGAEAEKSGSKFEKLGGVLAGLGKAMGAAALAAGAVAIKLGKEVVQQFGELEQNLGGSEAVFGEYAASIQKTGEEAYKNLGVSQSQYLATANKMGALFQGSGVEQQKSLELTEKAMQRAADMASVMGIDMQVALDSVAGAAKGNFTMMDNLGVAMNATNIEAYALAKGLDFTWKSATQAEKAEVAMQMFFENTEQYAGNFARESTQTISGSIGLLQAALGSFTAGLGNANADMVNLTENLVDAFQAVVANIVPVLKNVVTALPQATGAIISAVGDLLPTLLATVTELFTQVLSALLGLLPEIIPAVVAAVTTVVDALIDSLPLLIEAAVQLITALVDGIGDALPKLIPAAVSAITTIVGGLVDNLPMLLDAALKLILGLAQGLLAAIPQLIDDLPKIIEAVVNFLIGSIPKIIETGVQLMVSIVKDLPKIITAIVAAIPKIITSLVTTIVNNVPQIVGAGVQLLTALVTNLPTIIFEILKAVPQILAALVNGFKDSAWQIVQVGGDLIKGLWQGISDAGQWLRDKISGFFGGVVDSIKSFFGINSPSKLFAGLGENMAAGLGVGFGDEMKKIGRDMQNAIPTDFSATVGTSLLPRSFGATGTDNGYASAAAGIINNFNVSGLVVREEADIDRIANQLYRLQQRGARGMGVSFV
jgi:phage-related protein